MKKTTKSLVSRITVSRLYNLGNYENCSYSITVDVPPGSSASIAVRGVERILKAMKPIRPTELCLPKDAEMRKKQIKDMINLDASAFERQHGTPVGGKMAYAKRLRDSLKEDISKTQHRLAMSKKARDMFDDLGGAEKWKDAKLDWEYDDETF